VNWLPGVSVSKGAVFDVAMRGDIHVGIRERRHPPSGSACLRQ
jgi:hypothetical protein